MPPIHRQNRAFSCSCSSVVLLHRHLIVVATKLRIVVPYPLALAHGRLTVTRPSLDSAAAVSSLSRKHNTGLPAL